MVDTGADPATGRRRQKRKTFRLKKDADDWLADTLDAARRGGGYVEPSRRRLGPWLEHEWLPAVRSGLRPSTASLYETNVQKYIAPHVGGLPLAGLTTGAVVKLYAHLSERGSRDGGPLSFATVRNVHVTLNRALGDAVEWGLLAANPAGRKGARPRRPRGAGQSPLKVWSANQVRTWLAAVGDDRLYPMWLLFATTGLRRSEVCGLGWGSVHLDTRELAVEATAVSVKHATVVDNATKSDTSRRTLSLDTETVATLRTWRAVQLQERLAAGPAWTDAGFVFAQEDGRGLRPEMVSRMFLRTVERAGLPRLTLHGIRHSYATTALKAGVPIKVLSERLGHADPATTLRKYAHALPSDDREAAEATAAAILAIP